MGIIMHGAQGKVMLLIILFSMGLYVADSSPNSKGNLFWAMTCLPGIFKNGNRGQADITSSMQQGMIINTFCNYKLVAPLMYNLQSSPLQLIRRQPRKEFHCR